MSLCRRVDRLEAGSPSRSRFRVLFESEAEAALEATPKRTGETVIILPDLARFL